MPGHSEAKRARATEKLVEGIQGRVESRVSKELGSGEKKDTGHVRGKDK